MTQQETLYTIALSMTQSLNCTAKRLLATVPGGAVTVYENRNELDGLLPAASRKAREAVASMDSYMKRAEEEMAQAEKKGISILCIGDAEYPQRLSRCDDAPIVLYHIGNTQLNARHMVTMVGTRRMTAYGNDFCRRFVKELASLCPDAVIVSGLAYGVDICSHRAAIECGLPTIGVLAHGLDQIYPRQHRETAKEMTGKGGLLTEFPLNTTMDKRLFVQRNRIVAGISEATIVVESAIKGGSLRTAEYADGYEREVFAVPGRACDTLSAGCNSLIRNSKAMMLESAEQFVEAMGWQTDIRLRNTLKDGVQQELFPELTPDERKLAGYMSAESPMSVNRLAEAAGLGAGDVSALLFGMEMKGIVKSSAGGLFRLDSPIPTTVPTDNKGTVY